MKNMNKGVMIGTLAAALAAVTFAGCGSTIEQATNTAPARVEAAVATTAEAAKPEVKTEDAAKAKDTKKTKSTKKSKKSKKNTKAAEPAAAAKPAETQATVIQTPAPVVQVVAPAAQPAQTPAVEAPKTETPAPVVTEDVYPVWVEGDAYAGSYYEESAGRGTMTVTRNSDNTYSVEISWPSSASETNYWNLTGSIDNKGNLNYTNCRKTAKVINTGDSYTVYSAGSGSLKFGNCGVVTWTDNMGDILPGTRFVSYQPKAATAETTYNTKADEVGTAGSNYYANEGFVTGNFYDANGSKATLEIYKSNVLEGTYDVIVTCPVSLGEYKVYGFSSYLQADDALTGENGAVSCHVFDENNNLVENSILETGHYCQLRQNGNLIEWSDSDGSYYAFTR